MRPLKELMQYRRVDWELRIGNAVLADQGGMFCVQAGETPLKVMASTGGGWDHISVSTPERTPTWEEMELVRKLFALPHETWVQFGLPERLHINVHPHCLHWWRKQHRDVLLPPASMVG